MPGWIDHLLVLTLAVLFPIRAQTFGYRRLIQASVESVPQVRSGLYRQAALLQWGLVSGLAALWVWRARSWSELGLVPEATGWSVGLMLAATVIAPLLVWRASRAIHNEKALASVRGQIAHIERMIPHTRAELRAFIGLSITAGVCEELLFRGYLMWYFAHWLPPGATLAVSALLFGIGHSYQGIRGIIITGVVGMALGGTYLLAGHLYPAMLLHAAGDIQSGILAQAALSRQEQEMAKGSG